MGWTPGEVRACTLLDFEAAIRGWLKSKGVDADGPDTSDEAIEALERLMEQYPDG
ncbi:MAG: hypothetical protein AAFP68_16410 [Pseudomonadota bacterium]